MHNLIIQIKLYEIILYQKLFIAKKNTVLLESQSIHIEVFEDDVMYNFFEIFEIAEKGIKILPYLSLL